jgi:shikimate kinase
VSLLAPGRNLVLIGARGSGTTTVGRLVANRLGRSFADTGLMVEAEVGRGVEEIVASGGQRLLRTLEAAAIRRVSALRGQVIAVGAEAVSDPASVTHLRATGDLVVLDADPATLRSRLAVAAQASARRSDPGPESGADLAAQSADPFADLPARSDADYRRAALHCVDTVGRAPEQVVEELLEWARSRPGLLTREELESCS